MIDAEHLLNRFGQRYGPNAGTPSLFRAPARVNLIGEHTDYNEGLAMPAALQFDTVVALAARPDPLLRVHSTLFDDRVEIAVSDTALAQTPRAKGHWSDYITGVVLTLAQHGVPLTGADILIDSEVPLGSGLSSSASLEVCIALALSETAAHSLDRLTLARLCQAAENGYVGSRCGIMDQFASAFGRKDHALLLDCRTLEHRCVGLLPPSGAPRASIVVCNSMVKHHHAGGEYNRRRIECEQSVAHLAARLPQVRSLRDVSLSELEEHGERMSPTLYRRAHHVITENQRVRDAVRALSEGDDVAFGALMRASHVSLRDDYEVSCAELDVLTDLADRVEGVFGSRMTGGGFGGCTVHWVRSDAVERFTHEMASGYSQATGRRAEIHVCSTADGAGRLGV